MLIISEEDQPNW